MTAFIFIMAVLATGLAIMALTESDNATRWQLSLAAISLCIITIFLLLMEN